jgi:hypothetical protein
MPVGIEVHGQDINVVLHESAVIAAPITLAAPESPLGMSDLACLASLLTTGESPTQARCG